MIRCASRPTGGAPNPLLAGAEIPRVASPSVTSRIRLRRSACLSCPYVLAPRPSLDAPGAAARRARTDRLTGRAPARLSQIGAKGAELIAAGALDSPTLEQLDISHNGLGEAGGAHLGALIGENEKLVRRSPPRATLRAAPARPLR